MCTASPRSRWSAAGTRPAMRSPLETNGLFALSKPRRRWGTASSTRPSPAPGQRVASADVDSPCQRSTRGQAPSGPLNHCWDQFSKADRVKCTRMAKVENRAIVSLSCSSGDFSSFDLDQHLSAMMSLSHLTPTFKSFKM